MTEDRLTPQENRQFLMKAMEKFHPSTILVLDGKMTGVNVGDIRAMVIDAESMELQFKRATKLLDEITDMAICKVEGAAQSLRLIAGYPTGPYPDLERK